MTKRNGLMQEDMVFRKSLTAAAISGAVLLGAASLPSLADACSRILWNDNGYAVMVGRTMDWPESTQPILTVFPRGLERDGGKAGSETVVAENRPAGPACTAVWW